MQIHEIDTVFQALLFIVHPRVLIEGLESSADGKHGFLCRRNLRIEFSDDRYGIYFKVARGCAQMLTISLF